MFKTLVEIINNPEEGKWEYRKVNTVPTGAHFEDDGEYEKDYGALSQLTKRYRQTKPDTTKEQLEELIRSKSPRLDLEDAYTEQLKEKDVIYWLGKDSDVFDICIGVNCDDYYGDLEGTVNVCVEDYLDGHYDEVLKELGITCDDYPTPFTIDKQVYEYASDNLADLVSELEDEDILDISDKTIDDFINDELERRDRDAYEDYLEDKWQMEREREWFND